MRMPLMSREGIQPGLVLNYPKVLLILTHRHRIKPLLAPDMLTCTSKSQTALNHRASRWPEATTDHRHIPCPRLVLGGFEFCKP